MKKTTISMRLWAVIALQLVGILGASAQYWETGINGGAMRYYGDLSAGNWRPTASIFARYNRSPLWAFRGQIFYGNVTGSDAFARTERVRARNLSFDNQIFGLSAQAELNLMAFDIIDGKTSAPYIFAGFGGFYHNPTAIYGGQRYDLRLLKTEGVAYLPISMNFPTGVGIRFALGKRLNLGIEMAINPVLTDYLDDVATHYPDIELLNEANPTAAALSSRKSEFYGFHVDPPIAGTRRGDLVRIDAFYSIGIHLAYHLATPRKMEYNSTFRLFGNQ